MVNTFQELMFTSRNQKKKLMNIEENSSFRSLKSKDSRSSKSSTHIHEHSEEVNDGQRVAFIFVVDVSSSDKAYKDV
jgi:hypothetical protein